MSEEYMEQGCGGDCGGDCGDCGGDCGSCGGSCGSMDMHAPLNAQSKVKKVIGIVSGKGGVGKSLVTSLSAAMMNRRGNSVGILDADITGPSIPKAFGIGGGAFVELGSEEFFMREVTPDKAAEDFLAKWTVLEATLKLSGGGFAELSTAERAIAEAKTKTVFLTRRNELYALTVAI